MYLLILISYQVRNVAHGPLVTVDSLNCYYFNKYGGTLTMLPSKLTILS